MGPHDHDLVGPGASGQLHLQVAHRHISGLEVLGADAQTEGTQGALEVAGRGVELLRSEDVSLADVPGEGLHVRLESFLEISLPFAEAHCGILPTTDQPAALGQVPMRHARSPGRQHPGLQTGLRRTL